uniref:SDR family oxidoreductase n=1 Tax=Panagrellus redivivus TaxID=6233 RepID=A0A7E4VRY1_PANRE
QGELTNDATHDKIIDETIARFGKIDVLVNNAGVFKKPGDASYIESFDYVFAVNVRAAFRLVELATPHLEKTKGNIINVSSIASGPKKLDFGGLEGVVYAMTKSALDRYTQNINQSLMKKGIRINNINPGPFVSNFGNRGAGDGADAAAAKTEFLHKLIEKITPAGRFGQPEELVPAFLLLADEKSSFITGSIWVLDGGMGTWAPEATDLKL